ncbi:MAG: flavodoxin family protein [Rhizobiaceae bacterium]
MTDVDVRKGMPSVQLTKDEFAARFRDRFFDPDFDRLDGDIARIIDAAWIAYDEYHKNPRKSVGGAGFADPLALLPVEWLAARQAIRDAQARHDDPDAPSRILIVNGSARSDQSCPGEMSKTWRLAEMARAIVESETGFSCEILDLSRLASEYGRIIYPCKACVSTAQPLCHWPCSCYPNFAMGQVNDWMNEIYPKWVAAHGVMIITPVNWYQAPSGLKLMIDRLVCADGGNPDPTTTGGKNPAKAKELELKGWDYPRHLAGRVFAVAVHGDAAGVENLRRILTDWMEDLGLIKAAHKATVGAYVGYYQPYATSHRDLDADEGFQTEVRNAARSLVNAVKMQRAGAFGQADDGLHGARDK